MSLMIVMQKKIQKSKNSEHWKLFGSILRVHTTKKWLSLL